jgi:ribosomal protein S21
MNEKNDRADEELRAFARELGRRGGLKGGRARAEKLTPEERKEIARKAAKARWENRRQQDESSS